jgi:hypothetical protein
MLALAFAWCGCEQDASRRPYTLEETIQQNAAVFSGGIDVSVAFDGYCQTAVAPSMALNMLAPRELLVVNDIWMNGDVPDLPVIGHDLDPGIEPDSDGSQSREAFYVSFSRVVVDDSVALDCNGEQISEFLFAVREYRFGEVTLDDVERLVTKHQTATELPTLRLEAIAVDEEEP